MASETLRRGRAETVEGRLDGAPRLAGAIVILLLALGAMGISVAIHDSQPDGPGPFYTAPSPLPDGPPGTIIRSEVIDGYVAGAISYRVLYKSTGFDGRPAGVSGVVIVPDGDAPPGGRDILAYTHGTVGVAPRCSPSLVKTFAERPLFFEGGEKFIAAAT